LLDGVGALPNGVEIFFRLSPASAPDILTYCSVGASSIVSDGTVTNTLTNSSNLGNNPLDCWIQVSDDPTFATLWESPTITTGTP